MFRKYTLWETTDNKRTTINSEKHMALLVVFKACILYEEEEVVDGRSYAELCLNYSYKPAPQILLEPLVRSYSDYLR